MASAGGFVRRLRLVAGIAGVVALAWIAAPCFPSRESHAQDIQGVGAVPQILDQQQVAAVRDFAASAPREQQVSFTLSVGAAVPSGQQLQDMPRALGEALPDYINDQYLMVGDQFVIVEKNTRRIIAIVPIS